MKKTVLKKGARLFYFIPPPAQVKESPFAFLKAPRVKGCRKEKEREKERELSNRIETELFASSSKSRAFGRMFLFYKHTLSFGNEETNRGVRLLLENFIRIEIKNPFCPFEKGPTSPPPNWHAKEKKRKNDLILKPHVPYLLRHTN